MENIELELEGIVTKAQLKDILSVFAKAINSNTAKVKEVEDSLNGAHIDDRGHLILGGPLP